MDRVRKSLGTLLRPDRVVDLAPGEAKRDVVRRLGTLTCHAAAVHADHEKAVLDALWDRETILSTGIGLGMAVPHVRHSNVATEAMWVGRSRAGLAFDAIDGKPVHIVVLIAGPQDAQDRYLRLLARLSGRLRQEDVRRKILAAKSHADVVAILSAP